MTTTTKRVASFLAVSLLMVPRLSGAQAIFGVKGGFNLATAPNLSEVIDPISSVTTSSTSVKKGWALGAFLEAPLGEIAYFQPEMIFVTDGTVLNGANGATTTATLYLLEVPMVLRLGPKPGNHATYYALMGPDVQAHLHTSSQLVKGGATTDLSTTVNGTFRRAYMALLFGGGVTLNHYFIEGRYTVGLNDIMFEAPYVHANPIKNRAFGIMAGLTF